MYESVRMNIIKYDKNNLHEILADFLHHILIPRFNDMTVLREERFMDEIIPVISKSRITTEMGTHMKLMGDFKMMRGNIQEAHSLYSYLLKDFPNGIRSSYPSCCLANISCEIMLGECSAQTLEMIMKALPYINFAPQKLLFILVHYWISFKTGIPGPELIQEYLKSAELSGFNNLIKPFLLEQLACHLTPRRIPLELWKIKNLYDKEGLKEHSIRILFNVFWLLKGSQCNETQSYMLETIVTTLIHEPEYVNQPKQGKKWLLADSLGYLMIYRSLARGPLIATYLALSNPDVPFQSGFIKCTALSYSMSYSLLDGPSDFNGNWPQIAQKLFGSYIGDQFYSHSALRTNYVAVGDKIIIKVRVVNLSQYFAIGNAELRIEGNAISTSVECDSTDDIAFQIQVTDGGPITIKGVNVLWCEKIPLYSLFSQHPLTFVSIQDAPQLDIEILKCRKDIYIGELEIIEIVLHIGNYDLKTLSMLIHDPKQSLFVVNKEIEHTGDQYYFRQIKRHTDIHLSFGLTCDKACKIDPWVFFMFRSKCKLVRYCYFHPQINVMERDMNIISQFPSFSLINGHSNDQIPLQIKLELKQNNKFSLAISNKTHKEINNIIATISVNESQNIICGVVKKIINELKSNCTKSFGFQVLTPNVSDLILNVQVDESNYQSDLSPFVNCIMNQL